MSQSIKARTTFVVLENVLAVDVDAPHRASEKVARVEWRHGDLLALGSEVGGLGVLERVKLGEGLVDVVQRKALKVLRGLPREELVVKEHLAHLMHRKRRVHGGLEAESLDGVWKRAEMQRVRVGDEDGRHRRRDRLQVLQEPRIEEVIPPAVQQDIAVVVDPKDAAQGRPIAPARAIQRRDLELRHRPPRP